MIMRYPLKEPEKIRNRSQQEYDREYDYDDTDNLIDNPNARVIKYSTNLVYQPC